MQHKKHCKAPVAWDDVKTLASVRSCGRSRFRVEQELQIREALEIRLRRSGPGFGLNLNNGNLITSNAREPLISKLRSK